MDALPPPPIWRRYLRFWSPDVTADVGDELRFHLETRAEALVASGLSAEAAAVQALAELGDLQELRSRLTTIDRRVLRRLTIRDRWGAIAIELRFGIRRLRGTPGFTTAAALTLGLAIGATASVFGLVDGVLLKRFPYRDADRVLALVASNPGMHMLRFPTSPPDYIDWRDQNRSFATMAAANYASFAVTGGQEPERVAGLAVTPNYFRALGITPAAGRFLAADSAGPAEVVIGYGYWQRRFGGVSSVTGQELILDGQPFTVVGVMPRGLPDDVDLYTRLSFSAVDVGSRGSNHLRVYGRLNDGVSAAAAQRELEVIAARLAQAYPGTNTGWSVRTTTLVADVVGPVEPALLLLLGAACCVLLVGVANLANLFLVRCVAREGEMALRLSLGATRVRLVQQLLVEAAILGLAGAVLGVGLSIAGVGVLRHLAPQSLPRLAEVGVGARLMSFCALTAVVTVVVFGLLPAWRTTRDAVASPLKEGARGTGSVRRRRFQSTLVVIQVAVALVLLTGAALLVEGFEHLRRLDPGFRPEGVMTAYILLPDARYPTPERQQLFFTRLTDRLNALPGIDAASLSTSLPAPSMTIQLGFNVVGDAPGAADIPAADLVCASPGYFRTMGITMRRGRDFSSADKRGAPEVLIVDELLARQFLVGHDALSERLAFGSDTVQVVGVAASVKERGLAASDVPVMYAPLAQCPYSFVYASVRSSGDPRGQVTSIKRAVAGLDPALPVSDAQTLSGRVAQTIGATRFSSLLASSFAAVAAVLGAIGIYSVLSYVVTERRRELAIRVALGASHSHVVFDIVKQALVLTAAGIAMGSLAAWMLTRALGSLFLGVSPHDPVIFVGTALAFVAVALVAASIPALHATRVNPVGALSSS